MLGKLLPAVPSPSFMSLATPSPHLILSICEVLFTFPWARAAPSHFLAWLCPWNVFLCLLPSCSPFPVCPPEILLAQCERPAEHKAPVQCHPFFHPISHRICPTACVLKYPFSENFWVH